MIKIIEYTKKPISYIGRMSAICYNSSTDDDDNYYRGLKMLRNGHGEPLEFPDITFEADKYSIRVFRELLRHRHTTKLQQSTRYIKLDKFTYYTPIEVRANNKAEEIYQDAIESCRKAYNELLNIGISKEDAANILPLGTHSKVVMKVNLRELIHIAGLRLCGKAYEEIRMLVSEIAQTLLRIDDEEWKIISEKYLAPKCMQNGMCTEEKPCGRF